MTISFDWTDERHNALKCLHRKGLSFTQIANEIGCTRNAAIGKAHRLGLSAREASKPTPKPPSPARRVVNAIKKAFAVAEKKVEEIIPDKDYCCHLIELNDTRCRFPLWAHDAPPFSERLYCGAPGAELSAGKPYCKKHARLCTPQR